MDLLIRVSSFCFSSECFSEGAKLSFKTNKTKVGLVFLISYFNKHNNINVLSLKKNILYVENQKNSAHFGYIDF